MSDNEASYNADHLTPCRTNCRPDNQTASSLAAPDGSVAAAYQEGLKCGRSPTGLADENPYKHRLDKKRKAWMDGWLAGANDRTKRPAEKPMSDQLKH